jgi:hypothetical protein
MTQPELAELVNFLAATPAAVRQLAEKLSESETRWKPDEGDFSVIENICHLRDIELEGYTARVNRMLGEDKPFLADIDGTRLAHERRYNEQELNVALDAFTQARELNVRTIQNLSSEQLERTGMFEQTGSITLENLLQMMREHDEAHLQELNTLRGKLAAHYSTLTG